jgi:hypothetical protein
MPAYITIPKSEYQALLREVKRGAEVCGEVADLRIALLALVRHLPDTDKILKGLAKHAADSCDEVSRLRVELAALDRRLQEFDQELTPVRPPSRADIKAAFDNSSEFLTGKKKTVLPPKGGSIRFSFASKKDPRFSGNGTSLSVSSAHEEITRRIEQLETELGCGAPDDIEMSGMKV